MREVLGELGRALEGGRPCVWCEVVQTRGSTPQKAGACMLVFGDGSQHGTLGGGCIEAEVKQRALGVLAARGNAASEGPEGPSLTLPARDATPLARPELLTFCLDDNYGWDDGLICGGRMTILADPLGDPEAASYYAAFCALIESGTGCVEAVVMTEQLGAVPGTRFLFNATGAVVASRGATSDVPPAVRLHLPDLSRRPGPSHGAGVSYLPVLPRVTLLIVGGGHVGQAVGRLAAEADFDVEVLDDRESYVSTARFPAARRRLCGDIGRTLAEMAPTLGPGHYCLIVTRGHHHDEEALYHLAPTRAGYVGMIGSKRKIRLIFEDLLARGMAAEALARVHAPLGLDIGSQTVPEIAISIVAELIACRNLGTTEPPRRVRVEPRPGKTAEPVS
jgi:xanthine dehydrogenase accessory factor